MYVPFTNLLPALDPDEVHRVRSGRPASRVEILERHLRHQRIHQPVFAPEERPRVARISHRDPSADRPARLSLLGPATRVRRSIGRALIAAGERLERDAA